MAAVLFLPLLRLVPTHISSMKTVGVHMLPRHASRPFASFAPDLNIALIIVSFVSPLLIASTALAPHLDTVVTVPRLNAVEINHVWKNN